MAVYHCSVKSISRTSGRSATASAAYRAAEKVCDGRTGEIFDFTRKGGVLYTEVIMPDGSQEDRERLWNAAEMAEKRKDAKVAREFVVALPHELSHDQQRALVLDYARGLSQRTGWAVDVSLHEPGRQGDLRNVHAHLLCTTRTVGRDADGNLVLGKKTREWDVATTSKELVSTERELWGRCVNESLERAGIEARVDHRSYEEQGNGLSPTVHLGVHATGLERQGRRTELGDHNRKVRAENAVVIELAEKRKEIEAERRERAEAQAWQRELQRLETLPLKELERALEDLHPGSVSLLLKEDPAVRAAGERLREMQRTASRERQAVEEGWMDLQKAGWDWRAYEHAHPVASLWVKQGLWPDGEGRAIRERLTRLPGELDAAIPRSLSADVALNEALSDYEKACTNAFPRVEAEYEKRLARCEEALPILLKAQEAQYRENLAGLEKHSSRELHLQVAMISRRNYTEERFRSQVPGMAKVEAACKKLWHKEDNAALFARHAAREAGSLREEMVKWRKAHPKESRSHDAGRKASPELQRLEGMVSWQEAQREQAQKLQAWQAQRLTQSQREKVGLGIRSAGLVQAQLKQEQAFVAKAQALREARRAQEPERGHDRGRGRDDERGLSR